MSYTNGLDKPTDYFNTKLYTGTGATHNITGVGFQPDWVWIKKRSGVDGARMFDVVRGASEGLFTNSNAEEVTVSTEHTSFDSDGFSLGSSENVNESSGTFVAWNWLASNTTASNTDGSITSTVSANTTSGFSIVSYTGNGTDGATVGHGLGVNPSAILFKRRDSTSNWSLMGQNIGTAFSNYLKLETTDAFNTNAGMLQNSNSSTFTIGTNSRVNTSSASMIAYCFAEKKGYSKFGSYTGNGNADGTFVYTGFKPAWVMVKNTVNNARNWTIIDNKRNPFNPEDEWLYANASDSTFDASSFPTDFVSNGFKIRNTGSYFNTSGENYIYMAFAENPFVTSTGIPTTAR